MKTHKKRRLAKEGVAANIVEGKSLISKEQNRLILMPEQFNKLK